MLSSLEIFADFSSFISHFYSISALFNQQIKNVISFHIKIQGQKNVDNMENLRKACESLFHSSIEQVVERFP